MIMYMTMNMTMEDDYDDDECSDRDKVDEELM